MSDYGRQLLFLPSSYVPPLPVLSSFFFCQWSILIRVLFANTITSTIGGKNYKQLQLKLGKPSSESSHDTWRKYSPLLQKVRQSRCCKHFSSRFAGWTRIMTLSSWPGDRVTNINFNSDFNEDSNIRKAKVVFITTSHLFMSPRICVSCYFPSKRDVLSINVFAKDLGWWGMFQCLCGTQAVETLSSSTFTHPWYLTYYRPRQDDNTRSWWSSSQSRE